MSIEPPPEDRRKVAEMAGGTWAAPRQEYHEVAEREYIIETPLLRPNERTFILPYPQDMNAAYHHLLDVGAEPPVSFRIVRYEAREWQSRVWVPEVVRQEEYEAATNTLHYYGHGRIHRFYVWTADGAALEGEGSEEE